MEKIFECFYLTDIVVITVQENNDYKTQSTKKSNDDDNVNDKKTTITDQAYKEPTISGKVLWSFYKLISLKTLTNLYVPCSILATIEITLCIQK